jgi:hypothetical protein
MFVENYLKAIHTTPAGVESRNILFFYKHVTPPESFTSACGN